MVLLHTVSLIKKYIDISYKLDIPPSPTIKLYQISDTETAQPELYNMTSLFPDANNKSLPAPLSSYTTAAERSRRAGGPADEVQMWRLGHVLVPASPACQIMVALDSVHTAHVHCDSLTHISSKLPSIS